MSTPNEMVAKVADNYSRPDLEERILAQFPIALRSAHGINKWRRDQKTVSVFAPLVINGISTLSLLTDIPKLRKVTKIIPYSSYSNVGGVNVVGTEMIAGFESLTDGEFTYYGLRKLQTYGIFGNMLNLNGVESNTQAISVQGLYWPSYTYNALTDEYETDSWIMSEGEELVEAFLNLWVAQRIKDKDGINIVANELARVRQQFLATHVEEML